MDKGPKASGARAEEKSCGLMCSTHKRLLALNNPLYLASVLLLAPLLAKQVKMLMRSTQLAPCGQYAGVTLLYIICSGMCLSLVCSNVLLEFLDLILDVSCRLQLISCYFCLIVFKFNDG